MRIPRHGLMGAALAALTLGGVMATPIAARASEEGRRNTTLGLGALTGYLFTRGGSKVPAFIGAAGTAYAYKRYDDSIRDRHRREQAQRAYRSSRRDNHYRDRRYSSSHRDYYRRHDSRYDRHDRFDNRHDNGRHLGWYKGKHKGDKHHR